MRGDAPVADSFELLSDEDKNLNFMINSTIKKVSEDAGGRFNFNTAISAIMELVNAMYKYKDGEVNAPLFRYALKMLITLLAPFVPHICSEMWEHMGFEGSVHDETWPAYDESAMQRSTVEIVV
jgi:leucyl-tRNA synthetase